MIMRLARLPTVGSVPGRASIQVVRHDIGILEGERDALADFGGELLLHILQTERRLDHDLAACVTLRPRIGLQQGVGMVMPVWAA